MRSGQIFNGLQIIRRIDDSFFDVGSSPLALTTAGSNTFGNSITRSVGGTVDFTLPAGSQSSFNGVITTNTNTNGILGAFATTGGTGWATVSFAR